MEKSPNEVTEPRCTQCGQHYPNGWTASWKARRVATMKATLAKKRAKGEVIGAPRRADYDLIYKLKDEGHSTAYVARFIGKSKGTVQHAMRLRPKSVILTQSNTPPKEVEHGKT